MVLFSRSLSLSVLSAKMSIRWSRYAAMASKMAARQLMGARLTGVEGMPIKPLKPFYHVLPSVPEVVGMIAASLRLR